jgi:hypothetical protein
MSTNHSVGRSAATNKKDRSRLCAFTFADGRQCRTPRRSGHLHLCYFHAQKEAESLAAKQAGQDISRFLPTKLLTACDLGVAMSRLFRAVASGEVKPKVAGTLAYLAQTMLQSIPIAQHEYCEALGTDYWRSAIRSSFNITAREPKPAPRPQPAPKPPASLASAPTAKSASSPAPQPPVNCHSACPDRRSRPGRDLVGERSDERPTSGASPVSYREEPAFSPCPAPSPASTTAKPLPTPATHPARSATSAPPPVNVPQPRPSTSPREPNRDAPWLHFSSTPNIPPDSKLL